MNERSYIINKLDDIGRDTFMSTENWDLEDWRKLRADDYYEVRKLMGATSREFRLYKLNKILKQCQKKRY